MQNKIRRNIRCLAAAACLAGAMQARAERVVERFDLPTLYQMSDAVVRADITRAGPAGTNPNSLTVHAVKVTHVYKGTVEAKEPLQVELSSRYRRCRDFAVDDNQFEPLQAGDTIYLFLRPDKPRRMAATAPATPLRQIHELGLYLLHDGHVYGFGQYFPADRGDMTRITIGSLGFVTMTPNTFPGVTIPTREAFEKQLATVDADSAAVEALIAAPASEATKNKLIATLNDCYAAAKAGGVNRDRTAARLIVRLGEIAAPTDLVPFLNRGDYYTAATVRGAFGTVAGRDFLLDRVGDPNEDAGRRMQFARVLSGLGWDYVCEFAQGRNPPVRQHADFATRLARLAAANLDTELGRELLHAVADCSTKQPATGPLGDDLDAAAKTLSLAFDQANADAQFALAETVMQISPTRYEALLPGAGPMLTQLQPATDFDKALSRRQFKAVARFSNQLKVKSELKLVLHPKAGGPDVLLAIDTPIGGMTENFGSKWDITARLPDELSGAYQAVLRDFVDGRPAGDGLGFDLVVPAQ